MTEPFNIAVVGAGGFAHFATTEFVKIPTVKLFAIYDENLANAARIKTIDDTARIYNSMQELCNEPAIHLIYI